MLFIWKEIDGLYFVMELFNSQVICKAPKKMQVVSYLVQRMCLAIVIMKTEVWFFNNHVFLEGY